VVEAALMSSPQPSAGIALRKRAGTLLLAALAAGLLVALLAALVISGHSPEFRGLVRFSANKGLIAIAPADVTRVEIRSGRQSIAFHRETSGWTIDRPGGSVAVPAEVVSHVELGLRFLHVSEPTREIPANELTPGSFAEFGLDPPASVVALANASKTVATANFGVLNPAGTSQYVRLAGVPTIYLMPRHVGNEWQVASDMVHRLPGEIESAATSAGTSLLVPVSLAQVWAAEIVFAGKLTRFERDSAGNWFRHTGQHSHAGNANVHVADPAQAGLIAAALEAFDETAIETHVARGADAAALARFGLNLPPVIVMLYARDSSTPLARLEFGADADSFARYARLAPDGEVVTVAAFEVERLTELLKAVGAGS
jgi:acylphosphatase